jgi:predicted 3-demethylubiquinone-9 3-methyltransferase (glyoxalase superfamily)
MIRQKTQEEIDHFRKKLTEGGEEGPCGWLKDKSGVSWLVIPAIHTGYLTDPDSLYLCHVEYHVVVDLLREIPHHWF